MRRVHNASHKHLQAFNSYHRERAIEREQKKKPVSILNKREVDSPQQQFHPLTFSNSRNIQFSKLMAMDLEKVPPSLRPGYDFNEVDGFGQWG